jgi:hypothetical protein
MHLDLWMHQNTLAWNKLQVLIASETAFIAISTLVARQPWFVEAAASTAASIVALYLYVVQRGDVQIRDRHKEALFLYEFDPTPPVKQLPGFVPGRGTGRPEKLSHAAIFGAAILGNIVLATAIIKLPAKVQNLAVPSPLDVRVSNFPSPALVHHDYLNHASRRANHRHPSFSH